MIPSPSDLSYFLEVVQTKNLSRASERIGISQPSLSLAIQRIEQSLGLPVLVRSKKGVSLTPAGVQLQMQAQLLLQFWEQVKAKSLQATQEAQGSYILGCHPSVGAYMLPKFMPQVIKSFPKIEIKLRHDLSRKITEAVVSGEVDLGLVINPVKHPDLVMYKLGEDEVTLWASSTSPHKDSSGLKGGESVLFCDLELLQVQALMRSLKKKGISHLRVVNSSSLEVVASLTSSGAGVGILPTRVVDFWGKENLRKIKNAPIFKDEIYLVFRVESKKVTAIKVLVEAIKNSVQC